MSNAEFILEGRSVKATSAPRGFIGWKDLQAKFRKEDRKKPNAMDDPIRGTQVQECVGRNLLPDNSLEEEDLNGAWREFNSDVQKAPKKGGPR